jgi:hypothetical protein
MSLILPIVFRPGSRLCQCQLGLDSASPAMSKAPIFNPYDQLLVISLYTLMLTLQSQQACYPIFFFFFFFLWSLRFQPLQLVAHRLPRTLLSKPLYHWKGLSPFDRLGGLGDSGVVSQERLQSETLNSFCSIGE